MQETQAQIKRGPGKAQAAPVGHGPVAAQGHPGTTQTRRKGDFLIHPPKVKRARNQDPQL